MAIAEQLRYVQAKDRPCDATDTKGHVLKDLMGIMKQAQAMQTKLAEVQTELDQSEVEGQAGAGIVKVRLTGKGVMKGIAIDDSLMKLEEKEILEDLIVTAHEDAKKKSEQLMEEKMKDVTGGLTLPAGMKLPF